MISTEFRPITEMDAHCHLDLYSDPSKIISDLGSRGTAVLSVTTTPRAWSQNKLWMEPFENLKPALGLHPELISDKNQEFNLFKKYFHETHYIGEIGLDGRKKYVDTFSLQLDILGEIFRMCSKSDGKIISIHSVKSTNKVLDLIEQELDLKKNKAILHWFTGTQSDGNRGIDMGLFFSINPKMFSGQISKNFMKEIPVSQILVESDGPFTKFQSKILNPRNLKFHYKLISDKLSMNLDELENQLRVNFRQIGFNI